MTKHLLTLMVLVSGWVVGAGAEPVIRDVKIKSLGEIPVDEPMIRSYIATREGHELNPSEVAGDVRSLLDSGKISDVKAQVETAGNGVVLVYAIRMKSKLVRPVKVLGARDMSESKIQDLIGLNPGDYIDEPTVSARVAKLTDEYRKRLYSGAVIHWTIEPVEATRGQVALTLRVREGDKAQIV
ncbi:MAG: POTRA domain-containing protein, partial [bacterium]